MGKNTRLIFSAYSNIMKIKLLKRINITITFFLLNIAIFAQIPAGYYNNAEGKKQAELKSALCAIIRPHKVFSYGSTSTWSCFLKSDVDSNGKCWDMYSNNRNSFNTDNSPITGMNIEHSIPNSWWGHVQNDAYKDIHVLNPADATANGWKNNYPMGYVTTVLQNNGVTKEGTGTQEGSTTIMNIWEPADQYKGDFAREYMYMVTCYEEMASMWMSTGLTVFSNSTYPTFLDHFRNLLLKWNSQDPVDKKEIDRNNAIYLLQQNRNPYIDFPNMAEYVWGNMMTVPFTSSGTVDFPYLSTPSNGFIIDFGKIVFQQSSSSIVDLKALNLTGDLTVAISGPNASNFSVPNMTITKAQAETGYKLVINYNAQNVGAQTAQISITGGGISASYINLKANSTDNFQAMPANNVNLNGFDANWTFSANATGYTINVFSMKNDGTPQKVTLLEDEFLNGLPAGWTTTGFVDNSIAGNMKLASGSNPGKLIFPSLDLSTSGATMTVRARQYNNDSGAKLSASIDDASLAVWTTSTDNQDFTISIPQGTSLSKIALSATVGIRVYIDYVKIETQGSGLTPFSVTGYPTSVGNIFTYPVTGLDPDSTYYFTVQPEGNSAVVSNRIEVNLALVNEIKQSKNNEIRWFVTTDGIHVQNLSSDCSLNVLDIIGKKIQTLKPIASDVLLKLPQKGIYLLQVQQKGAIKTFKITF